ncbi:TonB-dependent receptor [Stenotrophomonas sp. ZAC14D1_NAIMI4_6]|uniref:TonB-dependent receptor n=1 Tax=unclassified Stenotrophomonas maltophilia group TaxID=2961925 RepID=UPI000D542CCA|nr:MULTISPECIES: TonB-dependent receptor [unclassified Stenotrophomonas maltophilia group]AWH35285.1 TonB-dependent receptor [Stenotrophomonas sp. ZAC14D1_NAIMI4_6]AWH39413.1 TonB-dependent receptor [Stenotrophomonas sp. ZAC14D1_NAIMI4_1]
MDSSLALHCGRAPLTVLALSIGLALSHAAHAQQTPEAAAADAVDLDKVEVKATYRESLQQSLDEKRYSVEQVDAIYAEDIGKFPDLNLAESMQRIAGVSIDREGGEGQQISVRGLGSDFTRVRINGLEALSTAGSGSTGVNRSRGFDFNTFASELFSRVKVNKTQSAQMDEGSLGATVDLRASRPFDFNGFQASLNGQYGYNELSRSKDPRVSALLSNTWADGRFGALVSAAWSKRTIFEEGYNPVRWEHGNYRNSNQATAANNGTYGFCSPAGYDPQTPRNPAANETAQGVGSAANQARSNGWGSYGIDATHCGTGIDRPDATAENIAAYETATNAWIPRYPRYIRTEHEIERLGVTGALQFRFSPDSLLNLDLMYSKLDKDQREDSIGANLHRTAQYGGKTQIVVREAQVDAQNRLVYGVFDNVDFRTESTAIEESTEFKQASLNFEHRFNDAVRLDALVGHSSSSFERPVFSMVSFDNSNLDGFVLDMRNGASMPSMTFPFALGDAASWQWLGYGTAPVNANGTARGGNISEVRLNPQYVDNSFDTAKVDLTFNVSPTFTLRGGLAYKDYGMRTQEYRNISYGRMSQALPDGIGVGDLSTSLDGFGKGLDGSTPGSWLIPDFNRIAELLDIYCNCNTGTLGGDYRLAGVGHFGASNNNFDVTEKSYASYLQLDFNTELWDRPFRGNLGLRYVRTEIDASGYAPCQAASSSDLSAACEPFLGVASATADAGERLLVATTVGHRYDDWLPSLNLAWDLTDSVVLRLGAAKTMARPTLSNLSPSVSGGPTSFLDEDRYYSINLGNPKLDPFRSTNYDLSAEWYFQEGALLSAAVFYKDIETYVQRTRLLTTWGDMGYSLDLLPAGFSPNTLFNVQSYFNTPGGPLKGYELTYQQPFSFLPGFWKNFGVQLNYTHVDSKIKYLFSSGSGDTIVTTYTENDLLNLSPNSYNATVYYDDGRFSARVSTSYRDAYINQILTQENVWDLDGNQYATADVTGKYSVENVDFNMSWKFNKQLTVSFEAINLLDSADERFVDSALSLPDRYTHTGRQYYLGLRYKF